LFIARTDSSIFDNIYRKLPTFGIGPFRFRITAEEEYTDYPDYSVYEITHDGVTVPFLLAIVNISVHGGSKSSINLPEFMCEKACIFTFKMYATVCVPLDTPTVLYLHHHVATSGGWTPDSLCKGCLEEFQPTLRHFIGRCNVCLRQALSLRSLASYTVFHLTHNLSEFTLTHRTIYQHYVYAAQSDIVPSDTLIPRTLPQLQCTFVWDNLCDIRKRFHKVCLMPSRRYYYTYYVEYCAIREEAIPTLCNEKDIWLFDLCTRTLFRTTECLYC